ncbi:MAG TPA: response regulator [Chloroflexus aurantiacus]|jgi:CheY-like chemotaxis protein|uniref:Response regulator receiver n=1 Tax=Chloroflexus aurantiacus (strain ATCC 29366 / DSM 635 / J-10-fl) TaxID=324602 RepID=A9WFM7_CHLAA|nr:MULTISPECIES: response regulator [Chloroflexus]ABY33965.1 response regulator receiver [Chloroflexus aurantiacus J-10-fl]GIV93808.1 MAG: Fis family transcriptional regulator [Chloroflexus sp.]HBW68861.1 response regulator [Chloroflexus aurantiacus]
MPANKGTIFIIDDDLGLQNILSIALRNAGYDVVLARDGLEGLRMLEHLSPSLVISDIMMPNMDGVETFQRIKERLQDNGIPIFLITALNRKPWFADLEAEGAVIIQKPFEVHHLVELIDRTLS